MSNYDSKGRPFAHTETPWHVDSAYGEKGVYITSTPTSVLVAKMRDTQSAANAARIVACVNACEGIRDPERMIPAVIQLLMKHAEEGYPSSSTMLAIDATDILETYDAATTL